VTCDIQEPSNHHRCPGPGTRPVSDASTCRWSIYRIVFCIRSDREHDQCLTPVLWLLGAEQTSDRMGSMSITSSIRRQRRALAFHGDTSVGLKPCIHVHLIPSLQTLFVLIQQTLVRPLPYYLLHPVAFKILPILGEIGC
jgi:hypothetical protein